MSIYHIGIPHQLLNRSAVPDLATKCKSKRNTVTYILSVALWHIHNFLLVACSNRTSTVYTLAHHYAIGSAVPLCAG